LIEQYVNTPDGRIFLAKYPGKANQPLAVVLHGWGENSRWYVDVARKLNKTGWSVVLPDLRGHGLSFGKRGFIRSWEDYTTDLQCILDYIQMEDEQKEIFLFGQSMGSLVILRYLQSVLNPHPVAGAVLSSLPVDIDLKFGRFQKSMMIWLNRIFPSFSFKYKLPEHIKRSNDEIISSNQDKRFGHRLYTPRWFSEFHENINMAKATDFPDNIPFLILHGEEDSFIDLGKLKKVAMERGVSEKDILSYENMGHKIFQEKLNQKVYLDIANWVEKNR